jgi:hypothetical protein
VWLCVLYTHDNGFKSHRPYQPKSLSRGNPYSTDTPISRRGFLSLHRVGLAQLVRQLPVEEKYSRFESSTRRKAVGENPAKESPASMETNTRNRAIWLTRRTVDARPMQVRILLPRLRVRGLCGQALGSYQVEVLPLTGGNQEIAGSNPAGPTDLGRDNVLVRGIDAEGPTNPLS